MASFANDKRTLNTIKDQLNICHFAINGLQEEVLVDDLANEDQPLNDCFKKIRLSLRAALTVFEELDGILDWYVALENGDLD